MSDAPAIVPMRSARWRVVRDFFRFRISLRGLMALVAVSGVIISGARYYQDYALVAPLVWTLKMGTPRERASAAEQLSARGPRAWLAERALIGALKDQEPRVRERAAGALGRITPHSNRTIQALIEALQDRHRSVQTTALYALQGTGPASVATVRVVGALARTGDARMRSDAVEMLGKVGTPTNGALAILHEALNDPDIGVAVGALFDLLGLEREPERALALVRKVAARPMDSWTTTNRDLSPSERQQVIRLRVAGALCGLAHRSKRPPAGLVDDLLSRIKDPDHEVRLSVIDALVWLGPEARRRASAIYIKDLAGADRDQARQLIWWLSWLAPENRAAVPVLVAKLGAADPAVRLEAIVELILLRPVNLAAPELARSMLLPDATRPIPGFLASLSGHPIGLDGWSIAARMRREKADSPFEVAAIVLREIGERGRAAAVRVLIDALGDPDADRRDRSARALGALGPAARATIPALKRALRDERPSVQDAARAALQRIMPEKSGD